MRFANGFATYNLKAWAQPIADLVKARSGHCFLVGRTAVEFGVCDGVVAQHIHQLAGRGALLGKELTQRLPKAVERGAFQAGGFAPAPPVVGQTLGRAWFAVYCGEHVFAIPGGRIQGILQYGQYGQH